MTWFPPLAAIFKGLWTHGQTYAQGPPLLRAVFRHGAVACGIVGQRCCAYIALLNRVLLLVATVQKHNIRVLSDRVSG